MTTFSFNFGCNVCRIGKRNRFMAFATKFDMYIENKIESFICCNQCSEMYKYEDIYCNEKYNKLCKTQKQIHCLFSFFDNDYNKLKNLKEKKKFLKEIIDRSNCHMNKPLLKKFLNVSKNIRMIESFKRLFLEDKSTIFEVLYAEEIEWEIISFRNLYSENLIDVFLTFLEYYLEYLMRYSRNYYDTDDIHLYILNQIYP